MTTLTTSTILVSTNQPPTHETDASPLSEFTTESTISDYVLTTVADYINQYNYYDIYDNYTLVDNVTLKDNFTNTILTTSSYILVDNYTNCTDQS